MEQLRGQPGWADRAGTRDHTGFREEVDTAQHSPDDVPPYDPRSGAHLWIVSPVYRVDPTRGADTTPVLDHENLLFIAGPVCFYCERSYETRMKFSRCKGEPRHGG
jgi:hypothetical protein